MTAAAETANGPDLGPGSGSVRGSAEAEQVRLRIANQRGAATGLQGRSVSGIAVVGCGDSGNGANLCHCGMCQRRMQGN